MTSDARHGCGPNMRLSRLLPVLLLACLLSPLQARAQRFDSRIDLTVGNSPLGTGIADLDGDGRQDLLSTVYHGATLAVFPNNAATPGTISFGTRLDFSTGGNPEGLLVADLDGDGRLDVVTANAGNSSISIYRNASTQGTISLTGRLDLSVNTAHRIAAGDFDGDSKPDLAVTSNSSSKIVIFRNTSILGSIGFAQVAFLGTASFPNSVAVADINLDGRPDIIAPIVNNDALAIYLNQSSGGSTSFSSPIHFAAGDAANGIGIGDLNRDGKVDVVTANPFAGTVSLFLNQSTSGVLSLAPRQDFLAGALSSELALGDFDRDGRLDVVVTTDDRGANDKIILLRNTETPSGLSLDLTLATGSAPVLPAVGDIDGDGNLDIAVCNHEGTTASVFRNTGQIPPAPGELPGTTNPNFPIVVITHGWQPCDTFHGNPPPWATEMKNKIEALVDNVNVLLFTWSDAFTGTCEFYAPSRSDLTRASAAVPLQGHALAQKLEVLLDACESKGCTVHMIGHSLGTVVNAYAARELIAAGHTIDQLTLLDPAINHTLFTPEIFNDLLPAAPKLKWVDNYIATEAFYGLHIGQAVSGAAANGGFLITTDHVGITGYYLGTINESNEEGFFFSAARGAEGGFLPAAERPYPPEWRGRKVLDAPILHLPDQLDDPSQPSWHTVTGNVHQDLINTGGVTTPAFVLEESSDSAMNLHLTVPSDADLLRLKLVFLDPGERDWFTLSFDGEVFFSYRGDVFASGLEPLVVPLEAPVAHLKGRTGILEVRLNSTGAVNAAFAVHSLEFVELTGGPPVGYYDGVDSGSQSSLRGTLHNVIDDHIRFPYTSSATDTWDILELADEDPNNSSNILDIYKNASYPKAGGGNDDYDREHTWPNSYGFPDDGVNNYPYTDCHALFLANSSYNSSRGNNPYRVCSASCTERPTDVNNGQGGGMGIYPGNSNWRTGSGSTGTWETWTGRRGDVARALFYLDVRYEGGTHGVTGVPEPDLILTDDGSLIMTSGGVNASVAYMGMLSTLLEWHRQDPVDDVERHHNEIVAGYQGNRNPFVDHPGWAACALGGDCGSYYTVTPCRVVDTRNPDGPYGGPILTSGQSRLFSIPGNCGIPASAESVSLNITVVGATGSGFLTFFPGGQTPPTTSTINFILSAPRANNAILLLSKEGVLGVQPFVAGVGQVHLIIDVSGYFD